MTWREKICLQYMKLKPLSDRKFQIALLAASLYPTYRVELSERMQKEGFTTYLRYELRKICIREAEEIISELEK